MDDEENEKNLIWLKSIKSTSWAVKLTDAWLGRQRLIPDLAPVEENQEGYKRKLIATFNPSHAMISLPHDIFMKATQIFLSEGSFRTGAVSCSSSVCKIFKPCS